MKRKILSTILILALAATSVTACGKSSSADKNKETLTVLNYGKYIDENAVKTFEKETGITVKYEEYESPEEMYTKYKAGSIDYDVICSSEYMVEKLINEGEVQEMDYASMENYKNLDPTIIDMSSSYDLFRSLFLWNTWTTLQQKRSKCFSCNKLGLFVGCFL